eukprot:CAMPEP_0117058712 /NCGR_PEP_ID=MMETSP0472-20121206/40786_1 /TAXON_ID=693140 ORGANISM="Tiarina fusus, Strain LIS" /NCGR_SAMPLE_ID=MMETSP0472 /ASSEMBLY_ACC=CAM_ASM_000603 /LENGTH=457 /DNA_ID=CAMNT_0004776143 /DNA_START=136 /DNA_END=1510 /DNA_ORIENTATION=-
MPYTDEDTNMEEYSDGYSTEELPNDTFEGSDSESGDEHETPQPPFTKPDGDFCLGNDIALTKQWERVRAERDLSQQNKRLSHSANILRTSAYRPSRRSLSQSTSSIPTVHKIQPQNFDSLRPPTPVSKSKSISMNFACPPVPKPIPMAVPDLKEGSPVFSRSKKQSSSKLRSKSFLSCSTNSTFPAPNFAVPVPLDIQKSKENILNLAPSTNFQLEGKARSMNADDLDVAPESSIFFGARRTVSDLGFPSPAVLDRKSLQRRSTGSSLYPKKLPSRIKDACEFISASTVVNLLQGEYVDKFDQVLIVDCRYTYEYQGGHIPNAISILPAERDERLRELFLTNPEPKNRVAIVFHCEFSSKRGPATYRRLRELDREAHGCNYNDLYYPYLYVMEGGYQNFFQAYPQVCQGVYVEMKDKRFKKELTDNKKREKLVSGKLNDQVPWEFHEEEAFPVRTKV